MNIIVVGCGKVGTTLVKELVAEKHSIVVIDTDITNGIMKIHVLEGLFDED